MTHMEERSCDHVFGTTDDDPVLRCIHCGKLGDLMDLKLGKRYYTPAQAKRIKEITAQRGDIAKRDIPPIPLDESDE